MNRVFNYVKKLTVNYFLNMKRFPISIACLGISSILICLLIHNTDTEKEELLMRLLFAAIFSVFSSVFIQFYSERFEKISNKIFQCTIIMISGVGYFFLLTEPINGSASAIRLFIGCFVLLCAMMYVPSIKKTADFNQISLSYFKSFCIAWLYGGILTLGLIAIYFAIDLLLIDLDEKIPQYIAAIALVYFAGSYFLSLLPRFNDKNKNDPESALSVVYPKVLSILVSYIAIPLIGGYTLVLIAYFLKILITSKWPIGQIGPMVLIYSVAGMIIYILSNELTNRFAMIFRKIFPFTLIISVVMQLISVFIRLDAYGFTVSRYYVLIFGIYSIICSLYFIISKQRNTAISVLLAGLFAFFSIVPPIDAFNTSRISQTNRIELILSQNGMLNNGVLTANSNISNHDKQEITSIFYYLAEQGYVESLDWIPDQYTNEDIYADFRKIFGFEPYYYYGGENEKYFELSVDRSQAIEVTGYDAMIQMDIFQPQDTSYQLENGNISYTIRLDSDENIALTNQFGQIIAVIPIQSYFSDIYSRLYEGNSLYEVTSSEVSYLFSNEEIETTTIVTYGAFNVSGDNITTEYASVILLIKFLD